MGLMGMRELIKKCALNTMQVTFDKSKDIKCRKCFISHYEYSLASAG